SSLRSSLFVVQNGAAQPRADALALRRAERGGAATSRRPRSSSCRTGRRSHDPTPSLFVVQNGAAQPLRRRCAPAALRLRLTA
ncbi:hypothetical protein, partial [Gordonia sputi]